MSTAGGVVVGITAALGLSAVVAAAAAAQGDGGAQALIGSGMQKFVKGDVEGSLVDFDQALVAKPSVKPYLWQVKPDLTLFGYVYASHFLPPRIPTTSNQIYTWKGS